MSVDKREKERMMMSILANSWASIQRKTGTRQPPPSKRTSSAICADSDAFQGQDDAQLLHNQQFTISHASCFPTHNANKDEETLEEICCTECGAILKKKDLLGHWRKQHQKTKGGRRNTQRDQSRKRKPMKKQECPDCHKTVSNLYQHLPVHSGDRPYPCLHCGKRFQRSAQLKRHQRAVHNMHDPYTCLYCGKGFGEKGDLRKHTGAVHLKQKPFKCPKCEQRFSQKGHLKVHERVHSGDKPFQCEQCPKRFADSSSHRRHERNVHK